jgi:hypothetical protein
MCIFQESTTNSELKEHIYLENIENEQNQYIYEEKDIPMCCNIFYADCESFVNGENHELYLLGWVSNGHSDFVDILNVCNSSPQNVVNKFLDDVTQNGNMNSVVYFHNLKYDYHLLQKYLNITSKCEKDNTLYSVKLKYKKAEIELRDSYKLLPFALSKFTKEFDLDKKFCKKEAIAYEYYTKENNNKIISKKEYEKFLPISKRKTFHKNVINKKFNPTEYYKQYLELDCLVLKKGIQKFNDLILEITDNNLSVFGSLTISSLTDTYMKIEGCYDGIFEAKGNLRNYISKAVYGGRVSVNKKYQKKVIEGKISDYDGVSLYPSAINRLCREIGLPCGEAKRFSKNDISTWEDKTYSILTIRITKVNKKQQIPFIAYKNKNGILQYTNKPPKEEIILDSITLQDYIKFHKIEYDLIDGVFWDNGSNKKMGEIVNKLFQHRLVAKKQNQTALSNVIKLMLNSAYGKTLIKKSNTKIKIIPKNEHKYNKKTGKWTKVDKLSQFNNYIYNNFNTIKSWKHINDKCAEIHELQSDNTYNRGHIGCAILSMSKRIMNEVFDIATDNDYPIYYTDTDSLHCNFQDVPKLEQKYKERYNKELNGKNLEQFHTDFSLDGARSEIYATKSIFLGKKSYMDLLESKDEYGNIINGYHIRLKGITEDGLKEQAKKYENSYEGLYTDLCDGKELDIVLNPFNKEDNYQKVLFEYNNGYVKTKDQFKRKVKF